VFGPAQPGQNRPDADAAVGGQPPQGLAGQGGHVAGGHQPARPRRPPHRGQQARDRPPGVGGVRQADPIARVGRHPPRAHDDHLPAGSAQEPGRSRQPAPPPVSQQVLGRAHPPAPASDEHAPVQRGRRPAVAGELLQDRTHGGGTVGVRWQHGPDVFRVRRRGGVGLAQEPDLRQRAALAAFDEDEVAALREVQGRVGPSRMAAASAEALAGRRHGHLRPGGEETVAIGAGAVGVDPPGALDYAHAEAFADEGPDDRLDQRRLA